MDRLLAVLFFKQEEVFMKLVLREQQQLVFMTSLS